MNEISDKLDRARERLKTATGAEGRLLTARTVAERLDLSTETVLRWVRSGQLPAIKLPGGSIRIVESTFEEWLASRQT